VTSWRWLAVLARCRVNADRVATGILEPRRKPVSADPTTILSQDGTPIAVWRSGEGPPLVLIHGTAADHNRWAPVLPALNERFTVFAIDRRGRGRSGDAADYALEREYEDVVAVVESAGEGVNVLGHSYGGMCAVEAALLTDRCRKLVLYEPPMGYLKSAPPVVERLQMLLEEGRRDELLGYFMQEIAGLPPDHIELLRSLPAWEARLDAADTIPREERASREYAFDPGRFRDLNVPTLYLQGGDSSEPFKVAGEALRAALPDCRVAVMPGQRHAAMDTATDLFTAEVLSFLEGPDRAL
jgi:pimeloyl-ACP methyl ester carboxylesterase